MAKEIVNKTMEVINRAERITNFIGTNCIIFNSVLITSEDANAVLGIMHEEKSEIYMDSSEPLSRSYNELLDELDKVTVAYITSITGKVVSIDKAKHKLSKYIKIFVAKVGGLFNMDAGDYVMYMLMNRTK